MTRGQFLGVVLGLAVAAAPAAAQPFAERDLPKELRRWVPWVLDEVEDFGCPRVGEEAVCLWPGRLELRLGASGGTFAIELQADRAATLELPGSADLWPEDVRRDGALAPVFEQDDAPRIRVPAGRHRVEGRFSWSRMPESLEIPDSIGLVELVLDGRPVLRPRRESGGSLWLGASSEADEEGDSLRVQVFRLLKDGIPLFVETRIQLEVSGRAREVTLQGALLPGAVPVDVSGDLPARVEDGRLRVQVRGGRYGLRVSARMEGAPTAIARPSARASLDWPERETWVFAADEKLRQVELSGLAAIDPSRTELPNEWRSMPAFLAEPGGRLALKEVRRGQPSPPPDAITLDRELWLDPDGGAATVRDSFKGTLRSTTRLDLLPGGSLGRASVDGQDQLVTTNPETQAAGIELRRAALQLRADSRLPLRGPWKAVGWTSDVETLTATLRVPPGWTLLGARGVDELPEAWTARWTLLGFFFVLIVALAAGRLFGRAAALLALATLVLLHGERGAPFVVWLSLVLSIALQRVAVRGRSAVFARLWFLAGAAILVVQVVPFARDQLTSALYPQARVASPYAEMDLRGMALTGGARLDGAAMHFEPPVPAAPVPAGPAKLQGRAAVPTQNAMELKREQQQRDAGEEGSAPGGVADAVAFYNSPVVGSGAPQVTPADKTKRDLRQALGQDPKAVLQTGPGVPDWDWHRYSLRWTGPVGRDHTVRLFLASPGLNRLLMLVRLALVALLGFLLVAGRFPRLPLPAAFARRAGTALLVLTAVVLGARTAAAEETEDAAETPSSPSSQILEQLKERLTRKEACEPDCVSTASLVLRLGQGRLDVSAEVHAAAEGSWAVPGPLSSWTASSLRVDGRPATAAAHMDDGFLRVRLAPGVHRVEASGPLPPGDGFPLQFPDVPRRARAEAPGWDVSGLRSDGPAEASILLTRRLGARGGAVSEGRYAAWLEVTRTLGFGVTWSVETRVRRVSPVGSPVAVRIPLLAGEAPTRASLVVVHGEAAVSLAADEAETSWVSTLEETPSLRLEAARDTTWSEVWRLECSAIWPCAATGLPPVSRTADGVFTPEYRPWPGESLEVALRRPQGALGQTLTIDGVEIDSEPGRRLERVQAQIAVRSSREQPLVVRLPKRAALQAVVVAGREWPSRAVDGELRLSVPAGTHAISLRWQQARGLDLVHALPRLVFSAPAVDVTQKVTLPANRWLLAVSGPEWGPAVLFWPYLLFVCAVALGLGRLRQSPLGSGQWLLLGLGVSQLPATGALLVAGFVFALALRGQKPPADAKAFDALQVLLVVWAIASAVLLYLAIQQGLLLRPEMQVDGNGSTETVLSWYSDRVTGELPPARVVSLPLWSYRAVMLAWSLWLAYALVQAVRPGWRAFGSGGYWRPLSIRKDRVPVSLATEVSPSRDEGGAAPPSGS